MRNLGAAHAGPVDRYDLAGLDLADERGTYHVEGACFARDDVAAATGCVDVAEPAEAQWSDAQRVACCGERVAREEEETVRAFKTWQSAGEHLLERVTPRARQQRTQHFCVTRRFEDGACSRQLLAEAVRVHQVSVVRQHDGSERGMLEAHRLRVR